MSSYGERAQHIKEPLARIKVSETIKAVGEAGESLTSLEASLKYISTTEPRPPIEVATDSVIRVTLVDDIEFIHTRIVDLKSRIKEIESRLEI
jgi:hypothetical protein